MWWWGCEKMETYFKRIGDNCVLDVNVWDMNALEISMWEISESIIWYYNACNIIDDIKYNWCSSDTIKIKYG